MYAQLIEGGTTVDRRTEMDRIVTDEISRPCRRSQASPAPSTSSTAPAGTPS
jgi:hypothetical protein